MSKRKKAGVYKIKTRGKSTVFYRKLQPTKELVYKTLKELLKVSPKGVDAEELALHINNETVGVESHKPKALSEVEGHLNALMDDWKVWSPPRVYLINNGVKAQDKRRVLAAIKKLDKGEDFVRMVDILNEAEKSGVDRATTIGVISYLEREEKVFNRSHRVRDQWTTSLDKA